MVQDSVVLAIYPISHIFQEPPVILLRTRLHQVRFSVSDLLDWSLIGLFLVPGSSNSSNLSSNSSNLANDTRTQLFVGNLPFRVRWQDVKDLFRKAGTILRANVALTPLDQRSRGHGTVLFARREDAERAVELFNGFHWQTRILDVHEDLNDPNGFHAITEANRQTALQQQANHFQQQQQQQYQVQQVYAVSLTFNASFQIILEFNFCFIIWSSFDLVRIKELMLINHFLASVPSNSSTATNESTNVCSFESSSIAIDYTTSATH